MVAVGWIFRKRGAHLVDDILRRIYERNLQAHVEHLLLFYLIHSCLFGSAGYFPSRLKFLPD